MKAISIKVESNKSRYGDMVALFFVTNDSNEQKNIKHTYDYEWSNHECNEDCLVGSSSGYVSHSYQKPRPSSWDFMGFVKDVTIGGITGAVEGLGFYGADRALNKITDGMTGRFKNLFSDSTSIGNLTEQIPSRKPQVYTLDLSHVTGRTAQARNRAIAAIIKEDFPDLNLTYIPEYSPFLRTSIAKINHRTQIAKDMFLSRASLRDTIIHEELHHRMWKRGLTDHHPLFTIKEEKFYAIIEKYKQIRGWD